MDPDEDFETVVFTADEFDGEDAQPNNSSDYFVKDVEWEASGEEIEVTFKDVDDPEYQEVVAITITEENSTGTINPLDPPEEAKKMNIFGDTPSGREESSDLTKKLAAMDEKPFGDPESKNLSSGEPPPEEFEPLLADTGIDTKMDVQIVDGESAEDPMPTPEIDTDLPWIPPATDDGEMVS